MTVSARRTATRNKLLDGATQVILRTGWGAASVEEICDEAGFTRGAFYSNFDSKDDLLIALLDRASDETERAAGDAADRAQQSPSELVPTVEAAVVYFLSQGTVSHQTVQLLAELRMHAVRTPQVREAYQAVVQTGRQAKAELVERALHQRGLTLSLDGSTAMLVLEGAASEYMLDALTAGRAIDERGLTTLITRLLTSFVEPHTGHDTTPPPGIADEGSA